MLVIKPNLDCAQLSFLVDLRPCSSSCSCSCSPYLFARLAPSILDVGSSAQKPRGSSLTRCCQSVPAVFCNSLVILAEDPDPELTRNLPSSSSSLMFCVVASSSVVCSSQRHACFPSAACLASKWSPSSSTSSSWASHTLAHARPWSASSARVCWVSSRSRSCYSRSFSCTGSGTVVPFRSTSPSLFSASLQCSMQGANLFTF
jgi:hypothetical protein